jgi:hypothetical protein
LNEGDVIEMAPEKRLQFRTRLRSDKNDTHWLSGLMTETAASSRSVAGMRRFQTDSKRGRRETVVNCNTKKTNGKINVLYHKPLLISLQ